MDYEKLKIGSYKYWDLYLHENQCYLGRGFAQLREDVGVEDFLAIEGAMRDEFFSICQDFKAALKGLFQPDKMNYAALSNTSPKIHVHLVPRYQEPREFAKVVFTDTRWGKNYAPYDRDFVIEESVLFQIRDAIKRQLLSKPKADSHSSYHLEHYDTIPHEEVLFHGISEEAFQAKGLSPIRPFSIFIKDQNQNVLGGVSGASFYGSLYVDSLWISPTLRHQGWGTKLMQEAEKIGKERGARFVTLSTMDWEALLFYQKLGYSIEFVREGYDKNSKKFMLRKNL